MFLKIIPAHVQQVRLFALFLVVHASRALTGSPLAVPSPGPRGIPSLVLGKLPWIAVATTAIAGGLPSTSVTIQLPRMAAECRGNCCGNCRGLSWQLPCIGGLPRMAVEIAVV